MMVDMENNESRRAAISAMFEHYPAGLKATQVAEVLGVSSTTVNRWVREGIIPAYTLGSVQFIVKEELVDLLLSNAVVPKRKDDDNGNHNEENEE